MVRFGSVQAVSLCLLVTLVAGCVGNDELDDGAGDAAGDPAMDEEDQNAWLAEGEWADHPEMRMVQPSDMIFGGSLSKTHTRVLLVPPSNGDLGNPFGPNVVDYLDATLRGIRGWVDVMDAFAEDYPEYAYLQNITLEIEVFDAPPTIVGYDVVIGYIETALSAFRGVAAGPGGTQPIIDEYGLGDQVHYGNRYILLSLFASAPRSGQEVPDFPEVNDLEAVTMHEFGHTFGLGHTLTWTGALGPDMMNSPYALNFGDGDPLGDGGERTHLQCISTVNLYGMTHLYRWIPNGTWEGASGEITNPLPYVWYCPTYAEPPIDDPRAVRWYEPGRAGERFTVTYR